MENKTLFSVIVYFWYDISVWERLFILRETFTHFVCRPLRREKERRGCCSSSRAFLLNVYVVYIFSKVSLLYCFFINLFSPLVPTPCNLITFLFHCLFLGFVQSIMLSLSPVWSYRPIFLVAFACRSLISLHVLFYFVVVYCTYCVRVYYSLCWEKKSKLSCVRVRVDYCITWS